MKQFPRPVGGLALPWAIRGGGISPQEKNSPVQQQPVGAILSGDSSRNKEAILSCSI